MRLLFNKNPAIDHWDYVQPLCLPDQTTITDCSPSNYHSASEYTADAHSKWTWIVIQLPEVTFSRSVVIKVTFSRSVVIKVKSKVSCYKGHT